MTYIRCQWDRVGAVLAIVGGLIALLFGWIGTSGKEYLALQLPYIVSGGLLGIFLLGVGVMFWISADLRDEWRQLHTVAVLLAQDEQPQQPTARVARADVTNESPSRHAATTS